MIPGKRKISRALISVFDKTGLLDFAKKLNDWHHRTMIVIESSDKC